MLCSFSEILKSAVSGGLLLFCGWLPWSGFGNMNSVMVLNSESWGLAHVETCKRLRMLTWVCAWEKIEKHWLKWKLYLSWHILLSVYVTLLSQSFNFVSTHFLSPCFIPHPHTLPKKYITPYGLKATILVFCKDSTKEISWKWVCHSLNETLKSCCYWKGGNTSSYTVFTV